MASVKARFSMGKCSAMKRGYEWNLTLDQYAEMVALPCHYCGRKLSESGSGLDRKDNDGEYSPETAVPCCGNCNGTFMDYFSYQERMELAAALRAIRIKRDETGVLPKVAPRKPPAKPAILPPPERLFIPDTLDQAVKYLAYRSGVDWIEWIHKQIQAGLAEFDDAETERFVEEKGLYKERSDWRVGETWEDTPF